MKVEIKNIYGDVLFSCEATNTRDAVLQAIKAGANLSWANLRGANLSWANLRGANLSWANLRRANLSGADLSGADLSGADLSGADLSGANLSGADLSNISIDSENLAKLVSVRTIVPKGDIIGYKKLGNGKIAKLLIPKRAQRVGGLVGRKCRASYARVLSGSGPGSHHPSFKYAPGKLVKPTNGFDPNPLQECRPGIHFFITKEEAQAY